MFGGVTRRDLDHAHAALARYQRRDEKAKEKEEHVVGEIVTAIETVGTAGLLGVAGGRFAGRKVGSLEASTAAAAALGVASHVAGFLDVGGAKNRGHWHAVGNGALAYLGAVFGTSVGVTLATKAAQAPAANVSGRFGAGYGYGYRPNLPNSAAGVHGVQRAASTPAELAALAEARGQHRWSAGVRQAVG